MHVNTQAYAMGLLQVSSSLFRVEPRNDIFMLVFVVVFAFYFQVPVLKVKVKVLLLYSITRPDSFSSALQPYSWQGTHPTVV